MKNLVICCDGTWNNPQQEDNGVSAPTNVVRLYNALAENDAAGAPQLTYYHPGLGGEEMGLKEKLLGGALGVGIRRHICSAYHWLANTYEEKDQVFIFGFSRGAFTARCLGGMLNFGLPNLRGVEPKKAWKMVHETYDKGYRGGVKNWEFPGSWPLYNKGRHIKVQLLGVWDTVGALGIPDDLELLNLFDDPAKWQFHDTSLGRNVLQGRHAMALDEIRSSFTVTRWKNAKTRKGVKEKWFPGVHSDVGGGYAETDLSNIALRWMIDEAEEVGLRFRPSAVARISEDPCGVLHNSYKGLFSKLRSRPRNIPLVNVANANDFHPSVIERQKVSPLEFPSYHPSRVPLSVGDSHTIPIYADTRWNSTGLYLCEKHQYRFSAAGEWQDSKDTCDWRGTQDGKLTAGDITRGISSFLGTLENIYKKFSKNESTDFLGTKRIERLNWFCLVGAITNDSGAEGSVQNDGSPVSHECFSMVDYEENALEVKAPGYLYAFANDVWALYENNHGSIYLTITRTK